MTGEQEKPSDQEEQGRNSNGIMDYARIISYNLNEGERPGGIKVRYKLTIVSGPRAQTVDARQAQVIKEVLQWSRKHRQPQQP